MRRQLTATAAGLLAAGLLLAGCSSDDAASAPTPTSSAPVAPSSEPSTAASSAATAPPSSSASPELAAWAGQFCTAAAGIAEVGNLEQPTEQELTDPATAQAFAVDFYSTSASAFTEAAGAMVEVGPPPLQGQEAFTDEVVTAFTSAGQTFQGLADQASAVDGSDPAAVAGVLAGLQDPFGPIAEAFAPLQDGASPEIQSALTSTPECATVGG